MGWNSWNGFGKRIDAATVEVIASAMVSTGMKDAGYQYVVIDDYWHGGRDLKGNLYPDKYRFPEGIKPLADLVHAKGLKLGIYSDAGDRTCGQQPGSGGHEEQDARTFAAWGIDYVKYDYCNAPDDEQTAIQLYTRFGQALVAAGRPMVYSICEWGAHHPWEWAAKAGGHLWRTGPDIADSWTKPADPPYFRGVETIGFEQQAGLEEYAGPGHWNDPDMLVVGLKGHSNIAGDGMSDEEYRTHFSLWCLMAAPLMAACDLASMDRATLSILTNREVIALNQDPLGQQGKRAAHNGAAEVWVKPLQNGDLGVGLFNRGPQPATVRASWQDLSISGSYKVRDLWKHQDLGVNGAQVSAEVASHGCAILRLSKA